MKYSDTDFLNLVARATPLHERRYPVTEGCGGDAAATARLEYWLDLLSIDSDRRVMDRRLELDDLDNDTCRLALGCVRIPAGQPLPAWAGRLRALLAQIGPPLEAVRHASSGSIDKKDIWVLSIADQARTSVPFWDVWVPFVTAATADLHARAGVTLENLGPLALCTLQSQLLANLGYIGARSLALEFRRYVARRNPVSFLMNAAPDEPPSRALYDQFVKEIREGRLLAFFQEYPVLARFVSVVAGSWVDQAVEFCERLQTDRPLLSEKFNGGRDPGPVVALKVGLSDPHHERRTVMLPTFACRLKLVYKPKDLGVDEAFWKFVDWLNTHGEERSQPRLRKMAILNRGTHGWVEFIEHAACRNSAEVQRYYKRIGTLLCVAYVLGGTDFHQENIIANGEHPVLVDFETMLQPLPQPWDGLRANSADQRVIEVTHDSVTRTGLLPFWIIGDPGTSYDVSGIGAEEGADTGYENAAWDDINTDRMRLVYRRAITEPHARPMLGSDLVSAADHVSDMIDGFSDAYRTLLAHREALLSNGGPLDAFCGLRLRCLLRMTKAYGQIFNRRLHPEFLRDAADSGLELERLARDLVVVAPNPEFPVPWGIYRAEVEALERLDIPFFGIVSDAADLFADGRVVARDLFPETGLQRVFASLGRLGEQDLRDQTDRIRASLHARYMASTSRPAGATDQHPEVPNREPLNREQLIEAAVDIANEIRHTAIRGRDGSLTWLSLAFDPIADRMNILPMTDNLYDGRIGVGLFLAALEHATGGAGFRDVALAALLPLRKQLREGVAPQNIRMILGGASGLGGQIYTLARTAEWLADDELLHLADRAAGWFVSRRIESDDTLDVFGGSAGGILGLLTLSAARPNGAAVAHAVECGLHLLKKRVTAATGHRVWRSSRMTHPLTGFGHGAAGIAYALLRLSDASGEGIFRRAAEEGIAFETAVYSTQARNWPDYRDRRAPVERFMVAWCNGATGIGLGRLGGLDVLDNAGIRRDIDNALETTLAAPLGGDDHICCGNLGRIELLIEASRRLRRPELFETARSAASLLVRRAKLRGRYGLYAHVPAVTDSLSLFQGTAGIGYELLRLADSNNIPCALLWR
jgi:type 2 lantibiotic biosynthesis protein LanM